MSCDSNGNSLNSTAWDPLPCRWKLILIDSNNCKLRPSHPTLEPKSHNLDILFTYVPILFTFRSSDKNVKKESDRGWTVNSYIFGSWVPWGGFKDRSLVELIKKSGFSVSIQMLVYFSKASWHLYCMSRKHGSTDTQVNMPYAVSCVSLYKEKYAPTAKASRRTVRSCKLQVTWPDSLIQEDDIRIPKRWICWPTSLAMQARWDAPQDIPWLPCTSH